jgi:VWFA-related protein
MRILAVSILLASACFAQFKSTTQLVVAPTTVRDSKGHFVDGLTSNDMILTDNSVPQTIQMEWMQYPVDLVVAVQTSANAGPIIDKLGGAGILLSQLVAGDVGTTAVLSFSDSVKLHQEFADDPDAVTHAIQMLRMEGSQAHMLDALQSALGMLAARPVGRRRIVLMIAEKRDRDSEAFLPVVMAQAQRLNAAVYWLTWSPFLQPFTLKNKTAEDLKPIAERVKYSDCKPSTPAWACARPDETPVPYVPGPGGIKYAIGELARLVQPDLSELFAETTGGRTLNFLKENALEEAIQLIGQEVHRQYILTFEPKCGEPGAFHTIHVEVKGNPKLRVTTRSGYWAVE